MGFKWLDAMRVSFLTLAKVMTFDFDELVYYITTLAKRKPPGLKCSPVLMEMDIISSVQFRPGQC